MSLVFIFLVAVDIDVKNSTNIKQMPIYVSFYFTMIGFIILIDLLCFVGHLHIRPHYTISVKLFKICFQRIRREIDEIQAAERLRANDTDNDDKKWPPSSQEIIQHFIESNSNDKYDFYSIKYNSTDIVDQKLKIQNSYGAYEPSLAVLVT